MTSSYGDPGPKAGVEVDQDRLRRERRERCLAEMDRRGVDVLLLGRDANARYVSGARRLWLAGTRPFAPGCVVVRATGEVHLLAITDEGVPPEIPRPHLFPITWNPMNLVATVAAIAGVAGARRVGVDAMTPLFAQLLTAALPEAEWVDGDAVIRAARSVKTAGEVACIRRAVSVAGDALSAAAAAVDVGVSERQLLAAFAMRMAELGATTPAAQGTFCATPREAGPRGPGSSGARGAPALPLRQLTSDRRMAAGDLVVLNGGVLVDGYEGWVGRTVACGPPPAGAGALYERCRGVLEALAEAARPGATAADLRAAYEATGERLPPVPIAHGVGLGFEPPVVGPWLGDGELNGSPLQAGNVLVLQAYVWKAGRGGVLEAGVVAITDTGAVPLSGGPGP